MKANVNNKNNKNKDAPFRGANLKKKFGKQDLTSN